MAPEYAPAGMTIEKRIGNHHVLTFVPAVEGEGGEDVAVSETSDSQSSRLTDWLLQNAGAASGVTESFADDIAKILAEKAADKQDAPQISDQASAEIYDQTMLMLVGDKACTPEYPEMQSELKRQFNDGLITKEFFGKQSEALWRQYCSF